MTVYISCDFKAQLSILFLLKEWIFFYLDKSFKVCFAKNKYEGRRQKRIEKTSLTQKCLSCDHMKGAVDSLS